MSFQDWYNRQDKVHFREISRRYDFILLDCCAFGFSRKEFIDFNLNHLANDPQKQVRKERRALEEQLEVISIAQNIYVTSGVLQEFLKLIDIVSKKVTCIENTISANFRRDRKYNGKNTKGQEKLGSFLRSLESVLDLYQNIFGNLAESRTQSNQFYFKEGRGSTTDREIVSTALTHYLTNEDHNVAILTRDHDIMYLLIQHFQRQARARKEDLNQRLGVYFVSREEPSQAVEVKTQPYLSGNCG